MEKEIKIEIPEGYEIDKEKSTFEKIVFKKKEKNVNCWKDLPEVNGYFIDIFGSIRNRDSCNNTNVFLNEKYAKSALAMAQISQLLPYYDSDVNWDNLSVKHCIVRNGNTLSIEFMRSLATVLAFNTFEEADRFLKYNKQLVKDYYMID